MTVPRNLTELSREVSKQHKILVLIRVSGSEFRFGRLLRTSRLFNRAKGKAKPAQRRGGHAHLPGPAEVALCFWKCPPPLQRGSSRRSHMRRPAVPDAKQGTIK